MYGDPKKCLQIKNVGANIMMRINVHHSDVEMKVRCNIMDKLDQINENLTGFFKDVVSFVQKVWEYIEKFFTAQNKLYEGQNVEETT